MKLGNTYLWDLNQQPAHLWFVVSNPGKDNEVVIISASTVKEGRSQETVCILEPGEHPFIKHKSFIHYHFTKVLNKTMQASFLKGASMKECASKELIRKIQQKSNDSILISGRALALINASIT